MLKACDIVLALLIPNWPGDSAAVSILSHRLDKGCMQLVRLDVATFEGFRVRSKRTKAE